MSQRTKFVFNRVESIVGKQKKTPTDYCHFHPFPQCFLKLFLSGMLKPVLYGKRSGSLQPGVSKVRRSVDVLLDSGHKEKMLYLNDF